MKIALAQINTVVGDVAYNTNKAENYIRRAVANGAEAVLLPELLTTGYPPRDLLYREDLIDQNLKAKDKLVALSKELSVAIAFGFVERTPSDGMKPLYNAACIAQNGDVLQTRYKTLLPTYDVFEEYRYFEPGPKVYEPVTVNGRKVALIICEEAWNKKEFWPKHLYREDPVAEMLMMGADDIWCLNSSPYRQGVKEKRHEMFASHCCSIEKAYKGVTIYYVNQVGYNDEVGFDGNSFVMNRHGEILAHGTAFHEDLLVVSDEAKPIDKAIYQLPWQEEVLNALRLGVFDYFDKQNITGPAIIGLSGGIDSALVAYIAAWALGRNRVIGVGMPSEFSSDGSVSDAEKLAQKLGIHFTVQPIRRPHDEIRTALNTLNLKLFDPLGKGEDVTPESTLLGRKFKCVEDSGVTDENLQARIRGIYLMGLSNYYGGLVLSTSNKSESAVGYTTLYGDMCGGLAVISDLPKTMIFGICRWINETMRSEIIPWNTINKPPSAELRKDQKDSDSLPPYSTLDAVLYRFVDEQKSPREITKELGTVTNQVEYLKETGRDLLKDILWICNAVMRNEFKRKQAPTGLKVSAKLFKYGWQMPIVQRLKVDEPL